MKTTKKKTIIKRKSNGQFVPGFCPNPAGGPRKADTMMGKLEAAIARVETKKNKSIIDHFIEMAFKDKYCLVALMKKLLPDLKAVDLTGSLLHDLMSEEAAQAIREELRKRLL